MLRIAKRLNPEVIYYHDDMRKLRLDAYFDAVIIPDSIDHMNTIDDLKSTINTSYEHLNPGGILLITANIRENFRENNFVYTGRKDDIEITIFENNYISKSKNTNYEATFIYLIRRKDKLEIHTDTHTLGLFNLATWIDLFEKVGFEVRQVDAENTYDRFILGEGEYPQLMFICCKELR